MKIHRGVATLLKQAGAVLVRHKKHLVFKLPDGETITIAATPSDSRAAENAMAGIRKMADLPKEIVSNPNRVVKHGRTDASGRPATREWMGHRGVLWHGKPPDSTAMGEAFKKAGIVDELARKQAQELQEEMDIKNATIQYQEDRIERFRMEIELLKARVCPCFVCRIRRYFRV